MTVHCVTVVARRVGEAAVTCLFRQSAAARYTLRPSFKPADGHLRDLWPALPGLSALCRPQSGDKTSTNLFLIFRNLQSGLAQAVDHVLDQFGVIPFGILL